VADNTTLGQVLAKYFNFTLSITILPNHLVHSFIVVRMGNGLMFNLLHMFCVCKCVCMCVCMFIHI